MYVIDVAPICATCHFIGDKTVFDISERYMHQTDELCVEIYKVVPHHVIEADLDPDVNGNFQFKIALGRGMTSFTIIGSPSNGYLLETENGKMEHYENASSAALALKVKFLEVLSIDEMSFADAIWPLPVK